MSAWDIDPASVGNIIESEKTTAEQSLSPALSGVSSSAESVVNTCNAGDADAPLVAAAVAAWFSLHKPPFESVSTTVSNVLGNTVHAVNAYNQPDEESALVYQRQAK